MRRSLAVAFSLALCAVSLETAHAAENPQVRLRGTINSLSGDTLSIATREGPVVAVDLASGWKVSGVKKADIGDIKPGAFVGIASLPKASGGADGALEVVVFPAAMKGTGEGSHDWDLKPNSTMTNATVSTAVKEVDGRTVTLEYKGKEKKISITDSTPIVTFAEASKDDLKPGATVFIPAEKTGDNKYSAQRVVVGTQGVVPPM